MVNDRIILGIDPGTLICGIGIIKISSQADSFVYFDVVKNKSNIPMPKRLNNIFDKLNSVIKEYKPNEVAIETAFYSKNAQSALKIGQARGVAMLIASINKLQLTEYTPREIKKSIVGNGAASKEQVQFMVMRMLNIKKKPKYFDETDALAIALSHAHRNLKPTKLFGSWKNFIELNPERVRKIK